jgi:hypothetical protein
MTAGAGLQQAVVARSINLSLQNSLLILAGVAVVGVILAAYNVQKVWDIADLSFRAVGGVVSVAAGFWGSLAFAVLWENPNWVGLAFFVAVMFPTFGMIASKNWALRSWRSWLGQTRVFRRTVPYII